MLSLQELQKQREEKGLAIVNGKKNQIRRVDDSNYQILSQSGNGSYLVSLTEDGWVCECPDHKFREIKCKHIWAVKFSQKLREQVKKDTVIQQITISECVYCHSPDIKKNGVRHNKSGGIQRFLCDTCGKTFSINIGFERMKHNPQAVTVAMQLYFSGESLRGTHRNP